MKQLLSTRMRHSNRTFMVAGKEFRIRRQGVARLMALREEILDSIEDPEEVIAEARRQRVPADILTFTEHLPDLTPRFNYRMEWDNLAVLPISTHEEWLRNQVHRNVRNKIRKAAKSGIRVEAYPFGTRLAHKLSEIFNETPYRRGKRYPYYGRSVSNILADWSPDIERSVFLLATYEHEAVGFIKLLFCDSYARTSGTVAKVSQREKAPMNELFSEAVATCARRSTPFLIYGRYEYPGQTDFGLTRFKQDNGFRRVSVPRYYAALSWHGAAFLSLGLHRSVSLILPRPIVRALKACGFPRV